ncbi:MAG: DUF5958 family protein [Kiritimatiellia bacterium]
MKREIEVFINQVAQGLEPMEEAVEWFNGLDRGDQRQTLRDVNYMALQAHPSTEVVNECIEMSGLKPSYTPCVLMLKSNNLAEQTAKIINLPENEFEKAFRLLLSLLSIADRNRRQTECANGCSHWWHRDLSDAGVVSEVIHE